MDTHEKIGVAAASLIAALVAYFIACATAQAAEHEIRWRNPHTAAVDAIELCSATSGGVPVCRELVAPCAAGATCLSRIDLPHGRSLVSGRTRLAAQRSASSNTISVVAVDPVLCMASEVCRADLNGDGSVNGGDFGRFLGAFNTTWLP